MLYPICDARPFRMTVLAYDMGCPRRARRVRKALEPWRFDKQYSVYETRLGHGEFRGVLAELADCCDFAADRLAVWWPFEGLRLVWRQDRLQVGAREGVASRGLVRLPARIGNFVVCYDVTDPEALEAVAAIVAGETAMLQRSVYWLRAPAARLGSLMAHCAVHLGERDQLWAYPLGGNHELWQVGTRETAILPIATHHWRAP